MGKELDSINKLMELQHLLSEPPNIEVQTKVDSVGSIIECDIPKNISRLIECANNINKDFFDIFLGYEIFSEDKLLSTYENIHEKLNFFEQYKIDKDFNISHGLEFDIQDMINPEEDDPEEIKNIKYFLPFAQHRGDYLVFDLREKSEYKLIEIMLGHTGLVIAPTLDQHIADIIEGLRENSYIINQDDEVTFPAQWHQRVGVRGGMFEMDEYGGIIE